MSHLHSITDDGKAACRRMDNNGGERKGLRHMRWSGVPEGQVATFLFLLDNGDKTTGATEKCRDMNTTKAVEVYSDYTSEW